MKTKSSESDYDLKRAELKISNPYTQPGLIDHIPKDEEPIEILNTYSYEKYPDEKAYCAICKSHRHQEGLTSRLTNGHIVMVGSKCAADHFEQSWNELKKAHKHRSQRQSLLLDLDQLAPKASLIHTELMRWKIKMERFVCFRKRFLNTMNPLYELLSQEVTKSSELSIYKKIEGSSFQQELGTNGPQYERIPIHVLDGKTFFKNLNPDIILTDALQGIKKTVEFAANTDEISNNKLSRLRNKHLKIIENLHDLNEMHKAAFHFFSHKNLLGVANWASQSENIPGTYRVEDTTLIWVESDIKIALPSNYSPLDTKVFDLFDRNETVETQRKKA